MSFMLESAFSLAAHRDRSNAGAAIVSQDAAIRRRKSV